MKTTALPLWVVSVLAVTALATANPCQAQLGTQRSATAVTPAIDNSFASRADRWNVQPVSATGRIWALGESEPGAGGDCAGSSSCTDVGCTDGWCTPPWAHRCGIFAEFLYLRPRDAEVAYAVPIDGAIVPPVGAAPIQVGPIGIVDPDHSGGFRVGMTYALDQCSSIVATYTNFQSNTNSAITTNAPLVIRSLALHPGTANAASNFLDASAGYGVDFETFDLDYRFVWLSDNFYAVNLLVGARYGHMDQDFVSLFTNAGSTDTALTKVSFDGGGVRFGIDGERHSCRSGLLVYGKADTNFVAGDFRGRYFQGSAVDPVIVDTTWKAGRLVTMLDLEIGAGWQSPCGNYRVTAGYLINSWHNTVNTDEFIRAVQTNNFLDLGDTMTFDGLVLRGEVRF